MSRMRPKVELVKLESRAFLMDADFIKMTDAERGVYCTLIFYLYCTDGRCRFDVPSLARLCNCEDFDAVWENIKQKFQVRGGVVRHRRVTKELNQAGQRIKAKSRAGLSGDRKRWQSDPDVIGAAGGSATGGANNGAMAIETKRNEIEKERINTSNSSTGCQNLSSSISVRSRAMFFHDALLTTIRPRTQSDRTCFLNVARWLQDGCATGRFNEQIFDRVLGYAKEATTDRRPAAVFMALLKRELGYRGASEAGTIDEG